MFFGFSKADCQTVFYCQHLKKQKNTPKFYSLKYQHFNKKRGIQKRTPYPFSDTKPDIIPDIFIFYL